MATASLILHRGAKRVTLEQLREYPTPPAEGRWFPISHAKIVDITTEKLADAGYAIKRADYGVYADGSRFFGVMELDSLVTEGVGLAIGLRNSTDKSIRAGMCAGNRVFTCDNLAFSSEINYHRKHTLNALRDLRRNMEESVAKLESFKEAEARRVEKLQTTEMSDERAHDMILRATMKGFVPMVKMKQVIEQWNEPACDWGGHTAWRLLNAVTYILRGAAEKRPAAYSAMTMKLQALILRHEAGLQRSPITF